MPPPPNQHVLAEMAAMRARYTEGINAGVATRLDDVPPWIARIYLERGPYQRGVLLGVLLEEWGKMEDG